MARMIPAIPKDFHGSKGEERVFRALRSLDDAITVIHSFRWLHPGNAQAHRQCLGAQGEGDFVLLDPTRGVLVVEVKGGEVWCRDGEWFQRNRNTGHAQAVDPEAQASNTMYRIRSEVSERCPAAANVLFCHAVWFPDGKLDRTCLPMNCHPHMALDGEDVIEPEKAINRTFAYWRSVRPGSRTPGAESATIFKLLAPSFSIVRSVRQTLDEREEQLVQLNQDQAKILDFLDQQMHAAILGAAGTGKTLLAVEKAKRIASPSEPALFLCFNSALRDHLRTYHKHPNVSYHSFHGFSREITGPDGTLDQSVQVLLERLADDEQLPYAHLIVDEAQDFEREWLEFLKYRFRDGAFYVFYDRYQAVQGQKETSWLDDVPCRLVLTRNCRNTDPIARAAYRAAALKLSPTLGVEGPQPTLHCAPNDLAAVTLVEEMVAYACKHHKTPAHEIAVISLETICQGSTWSLPKLGGQSVSDVPQLNHVTATTVRRFKGLEASLVIVVDVDLTRASEHLWRLLLYIACSRARHALHIITSTPESSLELVVQALSDTEKSRPSWRTICRLLGLRSALGGSNDPFN